MNWIWQRQDFAFKLWFSGSFLLRIIWGGWMSGVWHVKLHDLISVAWCASCERQIHWVWGEFWIHFKKFESYCAISDLCVYLLVCKTWWSTPTDGNSCHDLNDWSFLLARIHMNDESNALRQTGIYRLGHTWRFLASSLVSSWFVSSSLPDSPPQHEETLKMYCPDRSWVTCRERTGSAYAPDRHDLRENLGLSDTADFLGMFHTLRNWRGHVVLCIVLRFEINFIRNTHSTPLFAMHLCQGSKCSFCRKNFFLRTQAWLSCRELTTWIWGTAAFGQPMLPWSCCEYMMVDSILSVSFTDGNIITEVWQGSLQSDNTSKFTRLHRMGGQKREKSAGFMQNDIGSFLNSCHTTSPNFS